MSQARRSKRSNYSRIGICGFIFGMRTTNVLHSVRLMIPRHDSITRLDRKSRSSLELPNAARALRATPLATRRLDNDGYFTLGVHSSPPRLFALPASASVNTLPMCGLLPDLSANPRFHFAQTTAWIKAEIGETYFRLIVVRRMKLLDRKRSWGEIAVGVVCLLLAAQVFRRARAADAQHSAWTAVYRGSTGPATPAQGYFIATLLVVFAIVLFSLFAFSRRA
jgi:hypothetical protein